MRSTLDLKLYNTLISANVTKEAAEDVIQELNSAIDRRYEIHAQQLAAQQLATQGDLARIEANLSKEIANAKTEMIKWYLGSSIAIAGVVIAAIKLF